ncbi:MAG TPA: patatin-like phospholipase family protein [Gemmataceae bacterium]|nr:patatin-like phospholipase family protein [Gemmataceae bacterium]
MPDANNGTSVWGWDWYWRHFLKGVCFHLPLVLVLVALLGLVCNVFGEEYGVIRLVLHEKPVERFLVGASLAVVALETLFVIYLLWWRRVSDGGAGAKGEVPMPFWGFAWRVAVWLLLTCVVLVGVKEGVEWWGGHAAAGSKPGDPPKRWVWWEALAPTGNAGDAWLIALLPLGFAAVVGGAWWAGRRGWGERLASLGLLETARGRLVGLERRLRNSENPRSRWHAVGVVVVTAAWSGAAVAAYLLAGSVPLAVVTVAGFAGFVAALGNKKSELAFRVNLGTVAFLGFIATTFCLSRYGWVPGLLAVFASAGVCAALGLALPGPARRWFKRRLRSAELIPPQTEHDLELPAEPAVGTAGEPLPIQLWPYVVAAGVVFFLLCNFSPWASPAPVVLFLIFVFVVVYGLATVVVRRAGPLVLLALLFFAILAGVQPYKFRFDGYPGQAGWVPSLNYDAPHDLNDCIEADRRRQDAFDVALRGEYDAARLKFSEAQNALRGNEELVNQAVAELWFGDKDKATEAFEKATREREKVRAAFAAATDALRREQLILRSLWRAMEAENRVIPPRHVRSEEELDFLSHDDGGVRRGDDGKRLLTAQDWKLSPEQRSGPCVVVTVSGGGLRSAAWTFGILSALELSFAEATPPIDFPAQVRIITGASGGMLGAAYYVTTLPPPEKRAHKDEANRARRKTELDELYQNLTRDNLTPLIRQQVFEDIPNLFSPWPTRNDRGKVLERVWSENLGGKLDQPFSRLRDAERHGLIPSLVFTPMMIEDGRRLLVSNLDMRNPLTNDGNMLLPESPDPDNPECYSRAALELFRLFPDAKSRFRLSTAARMSASFPFFSPAVSLPVRPRRRVVDAGYYDNYGVSLAASWVMSRSNRAWVAKNSNGVLLIQIRDGVNHRQRRLEKLDGDGSTGLSRATEEVSSPLEGLDNARVASSSFRNDESLEILTQFWEMRRWGVDKRQVDEPQTNKIFQVITFELPDPAALSWYLSQRESKRIQDTALQGRDERKETEYLRNQIRLMMKWWAAPGRNLEEQPCK